MAAAMLGSSALASSAAASPAVSRHRASSVAPVRDIACDAQSLPESEQGRVSAADVASGRAAKGYTCNTVQVGHFGTTGGFHVERYDDRAGHTCAYMDSTLIFPKDAAGPEGPGVYVLDMSTPARPVKTATLTTPAMLSPHESLRVNVKRGLLAADMGYSSFNPGFVDVFDLTEDCRHPILQSSTPLGIVGHESGFSPDGRTFWVAGSQANLLTAVAAPARKPPGFWGSRYGACPHGINISDDGNRLYMAAQDPAFSGLVILDVSQVQARRAN